MTKRPNKDSVLVKHKKWLAELQRTKERLTEEYIQETRKKEEEQLKVITLIKHCAALCMMLPPSSSPAVPRAAEAYADTDEGDFEGD